MALLGRGFSPPFIYRNRKGRPHAAPGRGRLVRAHRFRSGLMLLICAFIGIGSSVVARAHDEEPGRSLEYRVKAAFIFNFTKFVRWPANSFEDDNTPVTLGIVGNDPFGSILEETFEGRTAQGRRIVIKRFDDIGQASDCHMLFISDSQAEQLQHVLTKLDDLPILTIGDLGSFAQDGGMIGFLVSENRVKFEINVDAAKRSGLKISSKLLRLARVIRSNQAR